jgi:hypothetical protein
MMMAERRVRPLRSHHLAPRLDSTRPFPFKWRDWRDFGCGEYGDWACHLLAVAVSGLRLQYPIRVEASGPPVPYERNPDGAFRFTFPARGDDPPVTVTWHGKGSGVPADWLEGDAKGTLLLVGDKGMMLCNHPHFGGYIGEIARLGHVAFYAGGSIEWDGPAMKVTDKPEANQYVGREYRKGWEI